MLNDTNIRDTPCNESSCDTTAVHEIDVCVPITVEPCVDLGEAFIDCIEEPSFIPMSCGGWNYKKGKCKFTICQKLRIMIPIEFDVEAWDGPLMVNCSGGEKEEEDRECPHHVCCEKEEENYNRSDFYYFVKGRVGRLKS